MPTQLPVELLAVIKARNEARQALNQFTNNLNQVSREAAGAEAGFARVSTRTRALTTDLLNVVKALSGGIIAFVALRRVLSTVTAFATYQEAMIGVARTTDLTAGQMDELGRALTDLSTGDIPVAREQLANLAKVGGQLGVRGVRDLRAFTEAVAELEIATGRVLAGEEAGFVLARLLGLTEESFQETRRLASQFALLGDEIRANERAIASTAAELVGVLAPLRLSSEQITVISAALADVGQQPERARTAIQQMFEAIQVGARRGGQALDTLLDLTGRTRESFTEAVESGGSFDLFVEVLEGVRDRVRGSGAEAAVLAEIMEALGINSQRASVVFSALATNVDEFRRLIRLAREEAELFDKGLEDQSKLSRETQRQLEAVNQQLVLTRNSFTALKGAIGSGLGKPFELILKGLRGMFDAMRSVLEASPDFIKTLTALALVVASLIPGVAAFNASLGIVRTALIDLAVATVPGFTKAVGESKANVELLAALARQNLVDGFKLAVSTIRNATAAVLRFVVQAITLQGVLPLLTRALTGVAAALRAVGLANPFGILVGVAVAAGVAIFQVRDRIVEMEGGTVSVSEAFTNVGHNIVRRMKQARDAVALVVTVMGEMAATFSFSLGRRIAAIGERIRKLGLDVDGLGDGIAKFGVLLAASIEFSLIRLGRFDDSVRGLLQAVEALGEGDFDKLREGLGEFISPGDIAEDFRQAIRNVQDVIGAEFKDAGEAAGAALADGVEEGAKDGLSAAARTFLKELEKLRAEDAFLQSIAGLDTIEQEVARFRFELKRQAQEDVAIDIFDPDRTDEEARRVRNAITRTVNARRSQLRAFARADLERQVRDEILTLQKEQELVSASTATREAALRVFDLENEARRLGVKLTVDLKELRQELLELRRREIEVGARARIQEIRDQEQLVGLTRREREVAEQVLELRRDLEAEGASPDQVVRLTEEMRKAAQQAQQAADAASTFGLGLRQGLEDFVEDATRLADEGQRVFDTFVRGLEDTFIEFLRTGEFEWREFVSNLTEEIARIAFRQVLAQVIGIPLQQFLNKVFGPTQQQAAQQAAAQAAQQAAGAAGAVAGQGGQLTQQVEIFGKVVEKQAEIREVSARQQHIELLTEIRIQGQGIIRAIEACCAATRSALSALRSDVQSGHAATQASLEAGFQLVNSTLTAILAELQSLKALNARGFQAQLNQGAGSFSGFFGGTGGGDTVQERRGGVVGPGGPYPLERFRRGGIARQRTVVEFAEGAVPEAFVPVPSGRIPVELRGGAAPPVNVMVSVVNENGDSVEGRVESTRRRPDGTIEAVIRLAKREVARDVVEDGVVGQSITGSLNAPRRVLLR